jgi:alpha-L-fucosidase
VVGEIDLGRLSTVSVADLREPIEHGQVVSRYTLEGAAAGSSSWQPLVSGTTIGYRRLARFEPTRVRRLRLSLETIAPLVAPLAMHLYS